MVAAGVKLFCFTCISIQRIQSVVKYFLKEFSVDLRLSELTLRSALCHSLDDYSIQRIQA